MKELKPAVSVLMIAYNREDYIEEAILSILRQKTSFPFEIIIAEDCSTDQTLAICKRYKEQYPNQIHLIANEQNLGLQRNYIQAYIAAKGKYVAICDPDDYWISSRKLQLQFDFSEKNLDYTLCFHRVLNYYAKDGSKSLSNGGQKRVTGLEDLSKANYISNVSVFFRNGVFELPEGLEQRVNCDYVFHMLCAQKGKIYYSPKVMAVYRKHDTGIFSGENQEKAMRESAAVRQFLIDLFEGVESQTVLNHLKYAKMSILFRLYQQFSLKNETEKANELKDEICRMDAQWFDARLKQEAQMPTKPISKRVKELASTIRKHLSKLYPLPRIR
ncbi:MAG: glycosyltransferase [Bacteroidales bacterium]